MSGTCRAAFCLLALLLLEACGTRASLDTFVRRPGQNLADVKHALFRPQGSISTMAGDFHMPKPVASSITFQDVRTFTVGGAKVRKVQQLHMGVPVFGHTFTLGISAGGTPTEEHSFGKVILDLDEMVPTVTPTLTEDQALEAALLAAALAPGEAARTSVVLNVFYVKDPSNMEAVEAKLAYIVTLQLRAGKGQAVALDAHTGAVLLAWPLRDGHDTAVSSAAGARRWSRQLLQGSNVVPSLPRTVTVSEQNAIGGNSFTGPIYYDGLQNGTGGFWHGPKLRILRSVNGMDCYLANELVWTQNIQNALDSDQSEELEDFSADGYWGAAPFRFNCPANASTYLQLADRANGAPSPLTDLHGGVLTSFKMYRRWYCLDVLQGFSEASVPLPLRVGAHFGARNDYPNAFWSGIYFVCGDGDESTWPLTSLDIVTHELSHGVTELLGGNLLYVGEPGAMNEAFSDMAAVAAMSFQYNLGKLDPRLYDLGGTITAGGLRNISDQTRDDKSIICANDAYTSTGQGSSSQNGLDVHYSSGIYNRAFVKLATAKCWNVKLAFEVFLAANLRYWTAQSTWLEGYYGVRFAAAEAGYSIEAVDAAFQEVCVLKNCDETVLQPVVQSAAEVDFYSSDGLSNDFRFTYDTGVYGTGWCQLVFEVSDTIGNFDMFIGVDKSVTTTTFVCRASSGSLQAVRCTLTPKPGATYYLGILSYTSITTINSLYVNFVGQAILSAPYQGPCAANMACDSQDDCDLGLDCNAGYCSAARVANSSVVAVR